MADQKNPYGYDDVDLVVKQQGGGRYLGFKKGDKGRIIQIRIVSEPRYVNQHWILDMSGKQTPINCVGEECTYCGKSVPPKNKLQKTVKWGWIVIDREDEEVKIFTGPTLIARALKEISELTNIKTKKVMWGDPRTYDIQIERTEEPGKGYYKVTPIVEGKGEITAEEKKKVEGAGFDLVEELKGSKKSEHTGSYGRNLETAPSEDVNPEDVPANLGEDSEGPPF